MARSAILTLYSFTNIRIKEDGPILRCADISRTYKKWLLWTRNSQYYWIISKTQWKIAYDAIYTCWTSWIHTLIWHVVGDLKLLRFNMLKHAFQHYITCTNCVRVCQCSVVSCILAHDLHRLSSRVWASEEKLFIYIPICINTRIEKT